MGHCSNIKAVPCETKSFYGLAYGKPGTFTVTGDMLYNGRVVASFGSGYHYESMADAAKAARVLRRWTRDMVPLPNMCEHWSRWGRKAVAS